jgi:hypothetical protein
MGSGASTDQKPLAEITAEEISNAIAALGTAYQGYKDAFLDNGVDGDMVASMTEDEFHEFSEELGVTSKLHKKKILTELKKLQNVNMCVRPPEATIAASGAVAIAPAVKPVVAPASAPSQPQHAVPNVAGGGHNAGADFQLGDKVTRSPRELMKELFDLQGIFYNRKDPSAALEKIGNFVGAGGCDGVNSFDVFISYRVAADKDVAQTVYDSLRAQGVFAFLDSKCLVDGMPWKEGFMKGKLTPWLTCVFCTDINVRLICACAGSL